MTSMLGIVFMYIYAMLAYYEPILHSTITLNSMRVPICINPINCFIFVVNLGIRAGGGIGDVI